MYGLHARVGVVCMVCEVPSFQRCLFPGAALTKCAMCVAMRTLPCRDDEGEHVQTMKVGLAWGRSQHGDQLLPRMPRAACTKRAIMQLLVSRPHAQLLTRLLIRYAADIYESFALTLLLICPAHAPCSMQACQDRSVQEEVLTRREQTRRV